METAKTIAQVRQLVKQARDNGRKIGLVPTMGALHQGHISLIDEAVNDGNFVVVSIFVNPAQFGPGEDLDKYPRDLEKDMEICQKAGADVVFAPEVREIYPEKIITWVDVENLTEPLCGASRPGHFQGVTTVCAKLFNIVGPDIAYFGQKDAQQAVVIKRMVADLNFPLEIKVCTTIREADGLAISSRNQYLTPHQRQEATSLYKSLLKCRQIIEGGQFESRTIIAQMRKIFDNIPSANVEYISIVDAHSLQNVDIISGEVLVALAVRIGQTRLIDNILVDAS
jgi:pantoate--beta-alanine ligase